MTIHSESRYLVAYGSNLNGPELESKYEISLGEAVASVLLPDRELAFTCHSTGRAGGVLDVRPALGACAEGVIFKVTAREREVIRAKEGAKYIEREGWVYSPNWHRYWATYFEVRPEYRQEFVKPSEQYLSVVKWGYAHYGLNGHRLQTIAQGEKQGPESQLFTYGTLMHGQPRHSFLASFAAGEGVPCDMWGKLRTKGGYPMLIDHTSRRTLVPGETYRLNDSARAFTVLDRIEGARSHTDTEPGFYRTPVVVATQERGREYLVWCYVWWGDLPAGAKRVKGNSWRAIAGGVQ